MSVFTSRALIYNTELSYFDGTILAQLLAQRHGALGVAAAVGKCHSSFGISFTSRLLSLEYANFPFSSSSSRHDLMPFPSTLAARPVCST